MEPEESQYENDLDYTRRVNKISFETKAPWSGPIRSLWYTNNERSYNIITVGNHKENDRFRR